MQCQLLYQIKGEKQIKAANLNRMAMGLKVPAPNDIVIKILGIFKDELVFKLLNAPRATMVPEIIGKLLKSNRIRNTFTEEMFLKLLVKTNFVSFFLFVLGFLNCCDPRKYI